MARYQENPHRKKMWFGTQHHSEWIDCPLRNADMSPEGWGTEGTYLSGGGFSRQSKDSHRNFIFEWGAASSRQAAERMQAYRDGVYNKYDFDLVYFQDPLMYSRNVLPKRWAQPGIVTVQGKEVHSPLGRVRAIEAPSGILGLGVPMVGARVKSQSLVAFNELEHPKPRSVWVPIPEGETLTIVAWTGSDSGNNGLYARTLDGTAQKCGLVPLTFSGVPGVLLGTVGEFDFFGARAVFGVGDLWRDTVEYRWTGIPGFGGLAERVTKNGTTTNLFHNPTFGAASQNLTEVWRNLIPSPDPSVDPGAYRIGDITVSPHEDGRLITFDEAMSAGQTTFYRTNSGNGHTPVEEGEIYSARGGVTNLSDWPVTLRFGMIRSTSASLVLSTARSEDVTIPPGEYVEIEVPNIEIDSTWDTVRVGWVAPSTGEIPEGTQLVIRDGLTVMDKPGAPILVSSLFSDDPDLIPTTPIMGSTRLLSGRVPTGGISTVNCVAIQSSQWSREGEYSLRLINNSGRHSPYAWIDISPDEVKTVQVWQHQDKELTVGGGAFGKVALGSLSTARDLSDSPVNGPGDHLLKVNRDIANNSRVYLFGYFSDIGESMWFDLLTPVDTKNYNGPPFSGNTAQEGPEWLPGSGNSGCRFIGNPTWTATSGVNGGQIGYAATLKEVGDWQQ